jgi:dihydropteroate synthase
VAVPDPLVRVVDATLVDDGGPAKLVITGLRRARQVAEKVAAARGVYRIDGDRLTVHAVPSRLADAAGRVGGAPLADLLRSVVDPAIDAWRNPPPDVPIPTGTLPTSTRPVVLGVLNVTPDSFSDGGRHLAPEAAVEAGLAMAAAGADVVDVGGESTRPGATPVDAATELDRVLPVLTALAEQGVTASIDTTKAAVAREAVAAGAAFVNDVSAGTFDADMLPTMAELDVPYVAMHIRGTPQTMQDQPAYDDVVAEVFEHLAERLRAFTAAGVPAERLIVDPGIGFGKTGEHNLILLRNLRDLTSLGRPVLVGVSRKRFIGRLTGVDVPAERMAGSLAAAAVAVARGARLVRVHDVRETVQAVAVASAIAAASA